MKRDYLSTDLLDLFKFIINDKKTVNLLDCIDYLNDVKAYDNYAQNLSNDLTDISKSQLMQFIDPILKQDKQKIIIGKDYPNTVVQQTHYFNQTLKNEENISDRPFKSEENNREQWLINNARIHPENIMSILGKLSSDDTTFIAEVGDLNVWAAQYLNLKNKQKLISSFNNGSKCGNLSNEFIELSNVFPKHVVTLFRDNNLSMLLNDLVNAARYNINLISIIFRSKKTELKKLRNKMDMKHDHITHQINPDFNMVSKAVGCESISIYRPNELKTSLEYAFNLNRPIIVEVFIDSDDDLLSETKPDANHLKTFNNIKNVINDNSINQISMR